ncbi:MAG TPA: LysM peptidoglycan-binding domain-containing protein [Humisphaera sp.]|nr:LysM peptidoglycan-binding domain-containing protein [Humisphaera sp.]
MRKMILSGAAALALAVVGCQQTPSKPATSQARPSALDVSAPAVSSTPSYQPAPVTPPTEPSTAQPVMAVSSGAGGNYKVKKGDTLYSIAKQKYGDGKQWQKIVSANPGVSPSTLRVGQSLVIPQ